MLVAVWDQEIPPITTIQLLCSEVTPKPVAAVVRRAASDAKSTPTSPSFTIGNSCHNCSARARESGLPSNHHQPQGS
jgi:bacterioferritin-associated ferredoxin